MEEGEEDVIGGYFCQSQDDRVTTVYANMEDAIHEAQKEKMAPFVIYQMVAQPVGQRLTNGPGTLQMKVVGRAWSEPTLVTDELMAIEDRTVFNEKFSPDDQG